MTINWCDSVADPIEQGESQGTDSPTQDNPQRTSLDALYREHRPALLQHLCALVKDADLAEELLHDTFIRLSKVPALSVIKKPRPFMLKIAHNLALDYLRKQKNRPTASSEEAVEEVIAPIPEHLELLVNERRTQQLKDAIAELPPRAKEALMLAKFREMTLKEVANEMNITQTMVEKHLKTALQKCRTALRSASH